MNRCKLYMKLYRLFFIRKRVFSQSDGQGLALLGDLENVRPELKPN